MNILITGAWSDATIYIPELESIGHHTVFLQNENSPLPCDPAWVDGVICNGLFLHHPIEQFPNLRFIQTTSAGIDRIPLDYVNSHGIELHNARGVYSAPMAEYAICGVLQIYKQSSFFRTNQASCKWEKRRDLRELTEKTVLIIGCGSVGAECARRFSAFGCHVLGVDLYPLQTPVFEEIRPLDALDRSLSEADIVILTVPLNETTRGLINAPRLHKMKEDAVLVNISRGPVSDESALLAHLQSHPAFSAVLDVFAQEPLSETSGLWNLPNVLLTPHVSYCGEKNAKRLSDVILKNLKKHT